MQIKLYLILSQYLEITLLFVVILLSRLRLFSKPQTSKAQWNLFYMFSSKNSMNAHIIGVNREPDKHSNIGLGLYRLIVNFDVQLTILDAS